MTSDELRKRVRQVPFPPFRLHLADARKLDVSHPGFIFLLHHRPAAIIEAPDGTTEWVNLPIVGSIETLAPGDAA